MHCKRNLLLLMPLGKLTQTRASTINFIVK
ncbi:hypothetical protein [Escherichia phage Mt1B1_P10]|uniref:Uncharacterized protein n=1 Tax=Escherichia phage Mt1B1_P10 TaxID=2743960 RepID=A0A7H0XCA2_9CAUD|nr:hypothetical protein [Escherichia phage Mt1B1_P10]